MNVFARASSCSYVEALWPLLAGKQHNTHAVAAATLQSSRLILGYKVSLHVWDKTSNWADNNKMIIKVLQGRQQQQQHPPVRLRTLTPGTNLPFISRAREHWHGPHTHTHTRKAQLTASHKHKLTLRASARVNLRWWWETQHSWQLRLCCTNTAARVTTSLQRLSARSRVTFNPIIMAAVLVEPLWSILTLAEIDLLCLRSRCSQNWNWQMLFFFFCCPSQMRSPSSLCTHKIKHVLIYMQAVLTKTMYLCQQWHTTARGKKERKKTLCKSCWVVLEVYSLQRGCDALVKQTQKVLMKSQHSLVSGWEKVGSWFKSQL